MNNYMKSILTRDGYEIGRVIECDGWQVHYNGLRDSSDRIYHDVMFKLEYYFGSQLTSIDLSLKDIIFNAGMNFNIARAIRDLLKDEDIDYCNATQKTQRYFGAYLENNYGEYDVKETVSIAEVFHRLRDGTSASELARLWEKMSPDFPDEVRDIIFDYTKTYDEDHLVHHRNINLPPHIVYDGTASMIVEMMQRISEIDGIEAIEFNDIIAPRWWHRFNANDKPDHFYAMHQTQFDSSDSYVLYFRLWFNGQRYNFGLWQTGCRVRINRKRKLGKIDGGEYPGNAEGCRIIREDYVRSAKSFKGSKDDLKSIRLNKFIDHCRSKVYGN